MYYIHSELLLVLIGYLKKLELRVSNANVDADIWL
jgi:hypothetical protein